MVQPAANRVSSMAAISFLVQLVINTVTLLLD
jgi:hypothetical protein